MTTCVAVAALPAASVAVQVTVVLPGGNTAGALFVTVGEGSHRSLTVGVPRLTGVPVGDVHAVVMFAGAVSDGALVSAMEKFLDIAKKHWVVGRSSTRPVLVSTFGTVTGSEPSFAVPATKVEKLVPPLVDIWISTFGATDPPPTLQVMVVWSPHSNCAPCAGETISNGAPLTVTCIASQSTPPPPARLSRAVTLKCKVRLTAGKTSNGGVAPKSMSWNRGKVREGLIVGGKERKSGPEVAVAEGVPVTFAGAASNCSQSKVRKSPSGSSPCAVSVNGVLCGIVQSGLLYYGWVITGCAVVPQVLAAPSGPKGYDLVEAPGVKEWIAVGLNVLLSTADPGIGHDGGATPRLVGRTGIKLIIGATRIAAPGVIGTELVPDFMSHKINIEGIPSWIPPRSAPLPCFQ